MKATPGRLLQALVVRVEAFVEDLSKVPQRTSDAASAAVAKAIGSITNGITEKKNEVVKKVDNFTSRIKKVLG